MSGQVLRAAERFYDALERRWESVATQRRLASVLVLVFVGGLVLIELGRRGWLPAGVGRHLSTSHFYALHTAFTLLLLFEVIALVFGLVQSVARAAGMQFEILSLILVRQTFKELTTLDEPIDAGQVVDVVPYIVSDAVGALLIFAVLGLYYRLQRHRPISAAEDERASFVATKKLIALGLLGGLLLIGLDVVVGFVATGHGGSFFEAFYTLLVFADVLIVLVSMRYTSAYPVVFRYFGFAAATVIVRLALTAPRFWDAAMGLGAALFAVGLTWAYNHAAGVFDHRQKT
jgi:hypothetical protein